LGVRITSAFDRQTVLMNTLGCMFITKNRLPSDAGFMHYALRFLAF
jgi:hypothetical protein